MAFHLFRLYKPIKYSYVYRQRQLLFQKVSDTQSGELMYTQVCWLGQFLNLVGAQAHSAILSHEDDDYHTHHHSHTQ